MEPDYLVSPLGSWSGDLMILGCFLNFLESNFDFISNFYFFFVELRFEPSREWFSVVIAGEFEIFVTII